MKQQDTQFFKPKDIPVDTGPANFIPAGGTPFIGIDYGSKDYSAAVKGYMKDGIITIQEVEYFGEKNDNK